VLKSSKNVENCKNLGYYFNRYWGEFFKLIFQVISPIALGFNVLLFNSKYDDSNQLIMSFEFPCGIYRQL